MNRSDKVKILGAYVLAALDSAESRGTLVPQSAQTLINGVVELYFEGSGSFPPPDLIGSQSARQETSETSENLETPSPPENLEEIKDLISGARRQHKPPSFQHDPLARK